jgi:lysophospholipase L1-like esterase
MAQVVYQDPFDVLQGGPDYDVIARRVTAAQNKRGKHLPQNIDLAGAMTRVHIQDTTKGSSTLDIDILDTEFVLLDSAYFGDGTRSGGEIDPIDLRYGTDSHGGPQWWRLTQVTPTARGMLTLTWMERPAIYMTRHNAVNDDLKASRAKRTRAQFLKMLSKRVRAGGGIHFHSRMLNVTQDIEVDTAQGAVFVEGDSLAVGTEDLGNLSSLRDQITTSAEENRTSSQGLSDLNASKPLPAVLVVQLGTNDTSTATFRSNILSVLKLPRVKRVFWVNIARTPLGGTTDEELNDVLRDVAKSHPKLKIIDWKKSVTQGKATLTDGVHPDTAGYQHRARLIASALKSGESTDVVTPGVSAGRQEGDKTSGINPDEDLKIQGKKATPEQLAIVEEVLRVADDMHAPRLAVRAIMCAGIGETGFTENKGGGTGGKYVGVFQGQPRYFKPTDTKEEATYFLRGGKGFGYGPKDIGAIEVANTYPDMHPGLIAANIEGSYPNKFLPNAAAAQEYYGKYLDEADALIEAYGGGGSFSGSGGDTTRTYQKQYNFEVGTATDPREDYWECSNRLAEEVNWPYFLDGNHLYFDPETELIKQKPVAIFRRGDPEVLDWNYTWDSRGIATEMTLKLVCDPFQFRAGQVFKLYGFGVASTGSTVKLPGRWLISDIDRTRSDIFSTFTLKQPEKPKPEPKSDTITQDINDPSAVGTDDDEITGSSTPKDVIDKIVIPIAQDLGFDVSVNSVEAANARHSHLGSASDHAGPPAVKWAADISDGFLTPREEKLAEALAKRFDLDYTKGVFCEGSWKRFRVQLIHGANFPEPTGDHRDHVHIGFRVKPGYQPSGSAVPRGPGGEPG